MKDFGYYVKKGEVRRASKDISLAESLVKRLKENGSYILALEATEKSASIIFRSLYDCLREAIDAIIALEGYKSYSHQASILFLEKFKEFSEEDLQKLDNFRKKRNNSLYYGKPIVLGEAKEITKFYKNKINIMLNLINILKRSQ